MNRRSRAAQRPRLAVHWRAVAAGATILVALLPSLAAACARDGVPSVSLDGHLAVVNRSAGRVVLTTWSPFVFTRPARHGHVVTLAENNREVARTLPRDVFTHPWRWDFGDHTRPPPLPQARHLPHRGAGVLLRLRRLAALRRRHDPRALSILTLMRGIERTGS